MNLKPVIGEALKVAHSRNGVMEQPPGSNRGKEVTAYLLSAGLGGGYPWCAAYAYDNHKTAAERLGVKNPAIRTASCVVVEREARKLKIIYVEPVAGDQFLLYGSPEGYRRACHTGHVMKVETRADGIWFLTNEGNTDVNGSREGVGVREKWRKLERGRYAFVRWNMVASGVPAAPAPAPKPIPVTTNTPYTVFLSGRNIGQAAGTEGRVWFPINTWCRALGISWAFDTENQVVIIQGREAPVDHRQELHQLPGMFVPAAPIRQLAKFSGLLVAVDNLRREIHITKPLPK